MVGNHVFRVIASKDGYYNFRFEDPEIWACYRLRAPQAERSIYSYVCEETPLHDALREAFAERAADCVNLDIGAGSWLGGNL